MPCPAHDPASPRTRQGLSPSAFAHLEECMQGPLAGVNADGQSPQDAGDGHAVARPGGLRWVERDHGSCGDDSARASLSWVVTLRRTPLHTGRRPFPPQCQPADINVGLVDVQHNSMRGLSLGNVIGLLLQGGSRKKGHMLTRLNQVLDSASVKSGCCSRMLRQDVAAKCCGRMLRQNVAAECCGRMLRKTIQPMPPQHATILNLFLRTCILTSCLLEKVQALWTREKTFLAEHRPQA